LRLTKLFALLLAGAAVAVNATAYTRITSSFTGNMARWPAMPVSYVINQQGSSQIRNDSEFAAVHAAFRTWANVASADVRFAYLGFTPNTAGESDSTNLISFDDSTYPWSSGTLAVTLNYFSASTGITREADILFNPSQPWSTSGEFGRYDIQGVLTHEIGHFLGLDHSGMISSVMAPFGAPSVVDQRTLQYDDVAGVSEIYPAGSLGTGQIVGSVTANGLPVNGAHVVAVDASGTAVVGTVTRTSGVYTLRFLPPGQYRVFAEPLDGPVTESNLGSAYRNLNIDFGATYFPNAPTLASAQAISVTAEATTSTVDIQVLPRSPSNLNITRPAVAPRISRASSTVVTVSGTDLTSGALFTSSNPSQLLLGSPTFNTSSSTTAPTTATMGLTVSPDATFGPKNIAVHRGSDGATATGVFVVVDFKPSVTSVSPATGPTSGQIRVTVTGSNFRPGAEVFFGGMPSTEARFISTSVLDVLTPVNSPGPSFVQVINSDGTASGSNVLFAYEAIPPEVFSVSPAVGPPATVVTMAGANFDPFSTQVYFNGTLARTYSVTSTQVITAVPYGATSGPLTLVSNGRTVLGGIFAVAPPAVSANPAPATYTFTDASEGAGSVKLSFPADDDGAVSVVLPFTVSLFRDIYPAGWPITVTTNGFISLETGSAAEFQNGPLPSTAALMPAASGCFTISAAIRTMPRALIGPFFDDLLMVPSVSSVSTRVVGAEPNRRFIVQWSNLSILDESGCDLHANVTFQAVLFEGSNDVMFVYPSLSGPRSDGISATVGMQDSARSTGFHTSFNQPSLHSGMFLTYRFTDGRYAALDTSPPLTPVVVDGGAATNNTSSLSVSWTANDPESGVREYRFALGSSPGATDVAAYSTTTANFAVLSGLLLAPGSTYYFSVRAVNRDGFESAVGMSDGITVTPSLQTGTQIVPFVQHNETRYTGIALLASSAMSVTLRAMNDDGLEMASATVTLNPGQQYARLVSELFSLTSFEGWIQVEPSTLGLGVYAVTGSRDNRDLDGAVPRLASADFVALHPGARLWMVNPGAQAASVTLNGIGAGFSQTLSIPAGGRRSVSLSSVARVTSSQPLAAIEVVESQGKLALSVPEVVTGSAELTFADALSGGDYSSTLRLVNPGGAANANLLFNNDSVAVSLPAQSATVLELNSLFPIPAYVKPDALRVIGSAALIGVVDIASPLNMVSMASRPASVEFAFPHVAHGAGLFTGLCLAAGSAGATVTIDVYSADGSVRKSADVTLGSMQQIARLLSELVPSVSSQLGGYIRIRSSQPILAWEIYGSDEAFASGPPL
jgi:hypothetical protein